MKKQNTTQSFLWEFIKSPKTIGAIAPSSNTLAKMMLSGLKLEEIKCIVEYGAGTGSFTQEILKQLSAEAQFLAFEKNQNLCAVLKSKFPSAEIIENNIFELPTILQKKQIQNIDCIISGLPFAVFNEDEQNKILQMSSSLLKKEGTFRTFAYVQGTILPAGIRFNKLLKTYFNKVEKTRIVWKNLPPAFVYICHN